MNDLPDADVWVALSVPDHPHHRAAARYWREEAASERAFCRMTWLALPRILSERRIFGSRALDGSAATEALLRWSSHTAVSYREEPRAIEAVLRGLATTVDLRGGDWTDAYLAAFAIAGDQRLVSFDQGFGRFSGLSWLHLEP